MMVLITGVVVGIGAVSLLGRLLISRMLNCIEEEFGK